MDDCIGIMDFLQINVETQRGFVPVDELMRVIDAKGKTVCWNYHYELICKKYLEN